jgi:hypothetical protein
MRQAQLTGGLLEARRLRAEVRQQPRPALKTPVRTVRGLAGSDAPAQRRPVVGAARAPRRQRGPGGNPELHLRHAPVRCARVDRPGGEHSFGRAARPVRDDGARRGHGEAGARCAAVDELRRRGGSGRHQQRSDHENESGREAHRHKLAPLADSVNARFATARSWPNSVGCGKTGGVAADIEPHLVLIDHSTGETTTLEGRPVEELASTLVEQARHVRTACLGTPPSDDPDHE